MPLAPARRRSHAREVPVRFRLLPLPVVHGHQPIIKPGLQRHQHRQAVQDR